MKAAEKRVIRAAMRWQRAVWPEWDKNRYPEVYVMHIGKVIEACAALKRKQGSRAKRKERA